jgi:poly(3-hydroxybutyrate) depolymerase
LIAVLAACGPKAEEGTIAVQNASGRSGAYFIPAGSEPVPLLVVLHGSGGSGGNILTSFRDLANKRRFAIVAPDSRSLGAGQLTWAPGDKPGDVSPDLSHTLSCVAWVRANTRLIVDDAHVLIAGFSGGGSSAPYIASNRPGFTHAAVLHGGVFPGGIGPRRLPTWFSTGEQDRYRPPALVEQAASSLTALGFSGVAFHVYSGGHDLGDAELRDLIDWWLGQ